MTNICNKNDFTIKLRLSDKDGVVLPYTQFDWDIWFYTTKNKPFRTYCNNGIINDGTIIVGEYLYITVNGFDWGYSGSVYLKIFTTFANSLYIDGKETFSNNPYLVTSFCITDGFSVVDAVEEDDAGVIIANVDIEEDLVIPFRVGIDGTNGREVEFQESTTHIQWRYVGDISWIDLIALTDITGEDGKDSYQSYLDTTSDVPPLTEGAWADLRLANIDGGTFN